jgi:hypothetical protein
VQKINNLTKNVRGRAFDLREITQMIDSTSIFFREYEGILKIITKIKENYYDKEECQLSMEDLRDLLEFVSLLIWKRYQTELIQAWIDKTDNIVHDRCEAKLNKFLSGKISLFTLMANKGFARQLLILDFSNSVII